MDDADLEKLSVSPGKLKPAFRKNTTEYEIVVGSDVKELKVNPLTSSDEASYDIKARSKRTNERTLEYYLHRAATAAR